VNKQVTALERLADMRGFTGLEPIGAGLEFAAYRATDPAGKPVVLRCAHSRFDSNVNDPHVDTSALLVQEHAITSYLTRHGFPVARPVELVRGLSATEPDVLISDYVSDDGARLDSAALGGLLARLHRLPAPGLRLIASEGLAVGELIPVRLVRRWREIARLVERWPQPPAVEHLREPSANRTDNRLLHLDVRAANLRCVGGGVSAFLDWSNALIGDPLLELGRITEFARLPENGLDLGAVRVGYTAAGGWWPEHDQSMLVYQLDAAVMLALVFLSESPDEVRARQVLRRVQQLYERLLDTANGVSLNNT
jgi:aminoglycoside phosphotransferase (APT) family kinase protein